MKLISYSLFQSKAEPWEMACYIRGFCLNVKMNELLYPDWRSHLEVDSVTYEKYKSLFDWHVENANLSLNLNAHTPSLCEGMLWRLKPTFMVDVTHFLARDSDSMTTHREALVVQSWLEGDKDVLSLHDNPAHGGLMGGLVGFNSAYLKAILGVDSFEQMVSGIDLTQHGSDQVWMNQIILPKGNIQQENTESIGSVYSTKRLPQADLRLWESNLIVRFIGEAGFNEMECVRFFNRFDDYWWKPNRGIYKQYPEIFWWHLHNYKWT